MRWPKTCVYCATRHATTKDHVFARGFFLASRRGDLPKVPACEPCNRAKAELEHYLATVLPFGGRHADAAENLQGKVLRRLAKNQRLHRTLARGMSRTWTREAGVYLPTSTLPFEQEKLEQLCAFIARGLTWDHWGALITTDTDVWAGVLTGAGERLLTSWMAPARMRVARDLGSGTFSYEGVRATANPCMTMWMFSVYAGIKLSGYEQVSKVGAVTGSKRFMDELRQVIGEPAAGK